jgi:hypothetical protein
MPTALATAAILALAALWAATAALAAILWRRGRTVPVEEVRALLRALADRIDSLESRTSTPNPEPSALPTLRFDHPEPTLAPGPTLITVPDLSAPPAEASEASAELARRYGPLWDLADSGASAESIARASGQPIGQVELILGLRRRSRSVPHE